MHTDYLFTEKIDKNSSKSALYFSKTLDDKTRFPLMQALAGRRSRRFVWVPIYLKVHWLSNPTKTFSAHTAGAGWLYSLQWQVQLDGINNLAKKAQSMLERIGKASATVIQGKLHAA